MNDISRAPGALRASADKSTRFLVVSLALLVLFAGTCSLVAVHPLAKLVVFFGLTTVVIALSLHRLELDRPTIAIILAGFALHLVYLGYTSVDERNYDGGMQLRYIEYLAADPAEPPEPFPCTICQNPPLYYRVSAVAYRLFRASGIADPVLGVQLLTLSMHLLFVVFGVLTVRRLVGDRPHGEHVARLATAIVVFWPYSVLGSVRVHNDALVVMAMMGALFFLVRWDQEDEPRDLYLAAALTGVGLMVKSNGYIMVAVLLAAAAIRFWLGRREMGWGRIARRSGIVAAILVAAVGVNLASEPPEELDFVPALTGRSAPDTLCRQVLGFACLAVSTVGNAPYNYLYFDFGNFLREPYALARVDDAGRQLFWNHLVKSSLFGTSNRTPDPETAYELNHHIALVINWLCLAMLVYLTAALVFVDRQGMRRHWIAILFTATSLAFLLAFRMLLATPHHTDFRHVFPILVPMAMWYAMAVVGFGEKARALGWLGRGLVIALVALSVVYFLPKYSLALRLTQRTIQYDISEFTTPVRERTSWDDARNLVIGGNHTVELATPQDTRVTVIDVTLDHDDVYKVVIHGEKGERKLILGPTLMDRTRPGKEMRGMARYRKRVRPPVKGVERITIRPLQGNRAYSMGHFLIE